MRSKLLSALLFLAACAAGSSAQAQGYGGYGGYCGGGFYNGFYNVIVADQLPYFTLYPPVYYSGIVPRTIGYSPFAYPPGTMTPELVKVEGSGVMLNPFVPQSKEKTEKKTAESRVASAPLRMVNPYVDSPRQIASVASETAR